MTTILIVMKWYFIVLYITFFLLISNVEHLFMCLLAICMSLLEKKISIQILCPLSQMRFLN